MSLKQLRETRIDLTKPKYMLSVEKLPAKERKAAHSKLSEVHLAYIKLRSSKLSDIRDRLISNEKDLKASIVALKKALKDLKKIKAIVKATTAFLKVVVQVVALAA